MRKLKRQNPVSFQAYKTLKEGAEVFEIICLFLKSSACFASQQLKQPIERKKMNTEKEVINFAAETLTGDIRDFLVDRLRNFPKVWAQMTEDEQENEIEAATKVADNLVSRAVKIIASAGRKTVDARLEKITISKNCELKITTNICNVEDLTPCLNDAILLVTSGVDEFTGERAPCKADPDEPELFNQEYREADGEGMPETMASPAPENVVDAEFSETSEDDQPDEKGFLGIDGDDDEAA